MLLIHSQKWNLWAIFKCPFRDKIPDKMLNAKMFATILFCKQWSFMPLLFAITILLGCKNPQEPQPVSREENMEPYWPTAEWRIGYPENHGLDEARLSSLVERLKINAIRNMTSLLIVRDGKMIVEEYFDFFSRRLAFKEPHGRVEIQMGCRTPAV